MKEFLEKFKIPYVQINTENKNIDEVYEMVRKYIKKYIEKMEVQ